MLSTAVVRPFLSTIGAMAVIHAPLALR